MPEPDPRRDTIPPTVLHTDDGLAAAARFMPQVPDRTVPDSGPIQERPLAPNPLDLPYDEQVA